MSVKHDSTFNKPYIVVVIILESLKGKNKMSEQQLLQSRAVRERELRVLLLIHRLNAQATRALNLSLAKPTDDNKAIAERKLKRASDLCELLL